MIVLSEVGCKGKGPKWYRVLRLSTKISENKRKLGYEKLGQILESDKESYFDTTPYWYPSNLVDGCEKKRIDRQGLDGNLQNRRNACPCGLAGLVRLRARGLLGLGVVGVGVASR